MAVNSEDAPFFNFISNFFGEIVWEEFFVYIVKVIFYTKGIDLFVKILF